MTPKMLTSALHLARPSHDGCNPHVRREALSLGRRSTIIAKLTHSALLLCFICGCAKHETPQSAQIPSNVVEGVGIPGYIEIGMPMNSIVDKIPDATCEP